MKKYITPKVKYVEIDVNNLLVESDELDKPIETPANPEDGQD